MFNRNSKNRPENTDSVKVITAAAVLRKTVIKYVKNGNKKNPTQKNCFGWLPFSFYIPQPQITSSLSVSVTRYVIAYV